MAPAFALCGTLELTLANYGNWRFRDFYSPETSRAFAKT